MVGLGSEEWILFGYGERVEWPSMVRGRERPGKAQDDFEGPL